jgi:hypothetical protein
MFEVISTPSYTVSGSMGRKCASFICPNVSCWAQKDMHLFVQKGIREAQLYSLVALAPKLRWRLAGQEHMTKLCEGLSVPGSLTGPRWMYPLEPVQHHQRYRFRVAYVNTDEIAANDVSPPITASGIAKPRLHTSSS